MGFSFSLRSALDLRIARYKRAIVSIPRLDADKEKDLLSPTAASADAKFTTMEHLGHLLSSKQIDPRAPLLVFGLRNTLVNHRCVVEMDGSWHAIPPEDPRESQRPYYGFVIDSHSRVALAERLGDENRPSPAGEVFISGIPCSWTGLSKAQLSDTMLIEAADHSHLFHIPRGAHPEATDESRARWQQLHNAFKGALHANALQAAATMRAALQDGPPLETETGYLHQVLGVNDAGELAWCIRHDSLASIGESLTAKGFSRTVCLENSGSIQPSFFPTGVDGLEIPLLRWANFRPKGRALLVIELEDASFGYLNQALE